MQKMVIWRPLTVTLTLTLGGVHAKDGDLETSESLLKEAEVLFEGEGGVEGIEEAVATREGLRRLRQQMEDKRERTERDAGGIEDSQDAATEVTTEVTTNVATDVATDLTSPSNDTNDSDASIEHVETPVPFEVEGVTLNEESPTLNEESPTLNEESPTLRDTIAAPESVKQEVLEQILKESAELVQLRADMNAMRVELSDLREFRDTVMQQRPVGFEVVASLGMVVVLVFAMVFAFWRKLDDTANAGVNRPMPVGA